MAKDLTYNGAKAHLQRVRRVVDEMEFHNDVKSIWFSLSMAILAMISNPLRQSLSLRPLQRWINERPLWTSSHKFSNLTLNLEPCQELHVTCHHEITASHERCDLRWPEMMREKDSKAIEALHTFRPCEALTRAAVVWFGCSDREIPPRCPEAPRNETIERWGKHGKRETNRSESSFHGLGLWVSLSRTQ